MKSLKDKVKKFLKKNDDQKDIRDITAAAKDVVEAARIQYKKHRANGELEPLLLKIGLAADNISKMHSRMHIKSIWVHDIRESMKAIEELVEVEKKELI